MPPVDDASSSGWAWTAIRVRGVPGMLGPSCLTVTSRRPLTAPPGECFTLLGCGGLGSGSLHPGDRHPVSINPDAPAGRLQASYEIMLDSLFDEVIQLDENGYVLTWNRGAERLKGWTAEEAIGQHITAFYTDEDVRSGLADRELRVAREAGRYETEGWRMRKDGSRLWASIVLTAMRDADGELLGFVKVSRDQ